MGLKGKGGSSPVTAVLDYSEYSTTPGLNLQCTPVLKISTNSPLAHRMQDIIDIDSGAVISGESSIEEMGDALLERLVEVASGQVRTKAELLGQDDFIPWKRGVSL
jgi:altronate hydrolase